MKNFNPKQMNFLIVDDMDNMRRSIRAMLKLIQFGKKHYEAANGEDAWKILHNEGISIDFIISDWKMPKMNGIDLLSKVRASKKLRDTPFLIITAETNQTFIAEAAENDVDAYLTKPFVTATLEQKIIGLLKDRAKPSLLATLLKKARTLREKGDLNGAIVCAKKAVGVNNRSSRPLRELGRLFLQKQDHKCIICGKKTKYATCDDCEGTVFHRVHIDLLKQLYRGFYIEIPNGNNSFSFKERNNK